MPSSKNRVDKKLFEEVFKKGKTLKGKYFLLKFFFIEKNQKKFTFVVPSSVLKSAAKRNLFKRRGKYVLNSNKIKIRGGTVMIFIFNKDSLKVRFEELKEDILFLVGCVK